MLSQNKQCRSDKYKANLEGKVNATKIMNEMFDCKNNDKKGIKVTSGMQHSYLKQKQRFTSLAFLNSVPEMNINWAESNELTANLDYDNGSSINDVTKSLTASPLRL